MVVEEKVARFSIGVRLVEPSEAKPSPACGRGLGEGLACRD